MDSPAIHAELSRELNLFHITMMGLGMMIGAGVFLGVGNSIHIAGPGGVILTFTLNGLIAIFTAMSYAELSSAIPRAGGAYNFARVGFGRGTSFLAGWMEWFASSVAGSVYSLTFSIYVIRYLEHFGLLNWLPFPTGSMVKVVAVLVAMFFSVYIVTMTYALVSFATVVSVKSGVQGVEGPAWEWIGRFGERGFGEAISRLMPMGNVILTLAVIFASTSALNATIYSATRACYALGRDHMLPPFISNISRKRKTPHFAIILTGVIVIVVAVLLPTMDVASSASIMFLFLFFMVNVSVIKIRRNMGDELIYGYVMPLFPLFPMLAIAAQALLAVWLIHMSLIAWIIAPFWVLSGFVIYKVYGKQHVKTGEHDILVLEEEAAPEGGEYRIMVACANPGSALGLVRSTYKLCGAKEARVELLHMVAVPEQVPLTDAHEYMLDGKEAMVEVMLYLAPLFPVSTTIRYCRNVARGIVEAVKEKHVNMLIMGYAGRRKSHVFRLGSTIDPVIERSPCDIVIFKDSANREFKNILVPVKGGQNGVFALEIACILAEKGGTITAFHVDNEKKRFDLHQFLLEQFPGEQRTLIAEKEMKLEKKLALSDDVQRSILEESSLHDLVILGISSEPLIRRVTHQRLEEIVAQFCRVPLVLVRPRTGMIRRII